MIELDPIVIVPRTLGERCLEWCLEEAAQHPRPSPERIAWYHQVAVRNGKPLGIKVGNHCASAQSRALLECLMPGDPNPHEFRAAALELQRDAAKRGHWHSVLDVRRGRWLPAPGAWKREWTSFANPKLLGFVAYPGLTFPESEKSLARLAMLHEQVG